MNQALRLLCFVALVPLLGCNGGDDPVGPVPVQDANGFWAGTVMFQPGTSPTELTTGADVARLDEIEMLLTQDEAGRITGAGAIFAGRNRGLTQQATGGSDQPQPAAKAFEVGGSVAFPAIVLSLRAGGLPGQQELIYLRGEFVGLDVLEGRLIGGGFNDDRVRLQRFETVPRRP